METEEGLAAGAGLHGKELTSCFRGRFPHPEMGHTGNSTPRHKLEERALEGLYSDSPIHTYRWTWVLFEGPKSGLALSTTGG